jgi:hypothetical protein
MAKIIEKILSSKEVRNEEAVRNLSLNAGEFEPWWS